MKRALIAVALAISACGDGFPEMPVGADGVYLNGMMAPVDLPVFFDCVRQHDATIISAHRGGPASGFAENAIPTFANTLVRSPAFLEVDVARTRDGVLVLMHDDSVDRTTDGTGDVGTLTAAEFVALSLQDNNGRTLPAHPPTLGEALAWAEGRAILELDVKRGVSYEEIVAEVREANAIGRAIFITYTIDGASRLARIAPEAMIYTTITSARDLDTLERRGVDLSHIVAWLGDEDLNEDLARALNTRGVEVRWGLFDRDADFAGATEAGVESVAVNDPAAAYRAIDAADGDEGYAALQCVSAR